MCKKKLGILSSTNKMKKTMKARFIRWRDFNSRLFNRMSKYFDNRILKL